MANRDNPKKWIPSKEDLELIKKMASERRPERMMSDALGICPATFHARKQEYPEISEAIRDGKRKMDDYWFQPLKEILKEGPCHPQWSMVWREYSKKFVKTDDEVQPQIIIQGDDNHVYTNFSDNELLDMLDEEDED